LIHLNETVHNCIVIMIYVYFTRDQNTSSTNLFHHSLLLVHK